MAQCAWTSCCPSQSRTACARRLGVARAAVEAAAPAAPAPAAQGAAVPAGAAAKRAAAAAAEAAALVGAPAQAEAPGTVMEYRLRSPSSLMAPLTSSWSPATPLRVGGTWLHQHPSRSCGRRARDAWAGMHCRSTLSFRASHLSCLTPWGFGRAFLAQVLFPSLFFIGAYAPWSVALLHVPAA